MQPRRIRPAHMTEKFTSTIGAAAELSEWFNCSQVVDEKGAPLVVYHGTPNAFDEFCADQYTNRAGFYFTSDPAFASKFAVDGASGIAYEPEELAQGPS